jgi:uncharacterized protein with GYD domain
MLKYMIKFNYTSASWARMLTVTDDRTSAVAALLESLGGKMESMHWEVEHSAGYVTGYLPDSLCAAAAITAATTTGGYKNVEVTELLTQDQLRDVVELAKHAGDVFHAPGAAAVDRDV